MKSESATTKRRPGFLLAARCGPGRGLATGLGGWPGGVGSGLGAGGAPFGKAETKSPETEATRTRGLPSALKARATFSKGPALAERASTAPMPAPLMVMSGSSFRRFSAPEIRLIAPGSMKATSRRSVVSGESLEKAAPVAAKAGWYWTGSPRELRIATELAASPTIASMSTLTPQARSRAGSLEAVMAIGAIMKGMFPCWNFWIRDSGSTAAKTGPPLSRNWSTA